MPDLQDLIQEIISFRDERNWKRFHTPRNLSAALALEAGELQETMLWKTDGEIEQLLCTPDRRTSISSEIADVLIFGLLMCEATGINPTMAIREKLIENEKRYPANLSRDNATKYTKLC